MKIPLTTPDELQGKVLRGVVCLRSKLYSIDYVGGKKQSAEGVQNSVQKNFESRLIYELPILKEESNQHDDTIALTLSSNSGQRK